MLLPSASYWLHSDLLYQQADIGAAQDESSDYPESQQNLTFLLFLIVTLETPGTGFMPSFCIAFLLFFSERLCFPVDGVPSSAQADH